MVFKALHKMGTASVPFSSFPIILDGRPSGYFECIIISLRVPLIPIITWPMIPLLLRLSLFHLLLLAYDSPKKLVFGNANYILQPRP